jgi:hypothetical protein
MNVISSLELSEYSLEDYQQIKVSETSSNKAIFKHIVKIDSIQDSQNTHFNYTTDSECVSQYLKYRDEI